jgi:hypothetical protein
MPPLAKLITLAGLFALVILGMMRLPGPEQPARQTSSRQS